MHKLYRLIIISFLGLSAAMCSAQSDFEQGVSYYNNRAEKHEGLKVDSTNINLAIKHFTEALDSDKQERAYDYLTLCYYYKAAFVVKTKQLQKKTYLKGKTIGEQALKKYPRNKGILLWYIANYSKYGELQGVVASAKNGLADKMKKLTEKLMDIDSEFSDGAPHRILGVLHYKVPYIPLFLTWPSKEDAEKHLKKALTINPTAISNLYYYAEFLVEEKRDTEARIVLDKLLKIAPRKTALIEDMYDLSMAKRLRKKLTK